AANVPDTDFTDAAGFLRSGGQRGPQRQVLREGTYAINLAQFVVITAEQVICLPLEAADAAVLVSLATLVEERAGFTPIVLPSDLVGIVTVHDGPSLAVGEIIAPTVGNDPLDAD